MSRVDDIINMSSDRRRKLRLGKRRGSYSIEPKRSFSEERLLEFMRDNDYRTRDALRAGRKKGEPSAYDYEKTFGTWGDALIKAFGDDDSDSDKARYMIKSVLDFDLWTRKKYSAARKKRPDIIMSIYAVEKVWGSYSNLRWASKTSSFKQVLDEYLKLTRKLGRLPGYEDLKRHGLDMTKAIEHFGSKSEMDNVLGGKDEKRKRSKRETGDFKFR